MTPEYISAIAALFGAVGWPIAIVTVVVLLRREITQLLGRLDQLNFGGTGFIFNKAAAKAEIKDAAENLAESIEGAEVSRQWPQLDQTMRVMIDTDPAGAVVFSWKQLEESLIKLADKHDVWLDLRSARKSAEQLREAGAISSEMAEAIKSLYSTYKSATHSYAFSLDKSSIEEYVIVTLETREAIEKTLSGRL
ncbi:hypothetical protein GOL24_10800 [Sinorhizobium medicae]|nr:hypothetical protein [Sinorhizobium medicae]